MTKLSDVLRLEKLIMDMKAYEGLTLKQGRVVDKALKPYVDELREFYVKKNEGITKYGEEIDGTPVMKETSPQVDVFINELKELLEMQVDVGEPELDGEWFPEIKVSSDIASLVVDVLLIKEV